MEKKYWTGRFVCKYLHIIKYRCFIRLNVVGFYGFYIVMMIGDIQLNRNSDSF